MVDIDSLIGDGKSSGMVTISVESGGESLEYDFIVDGLGNLTGAYEQEYEYMDENRMSFSIIHDQTESRRWAETYAINVLANLIGIGDRKYSRLLIPDAELPAGGALFEPVAITDAVKKAKHEYAERQRQFMRLGIDGKSPDDIYFHTLTNNDRTDIDRFISKADLAYASLTSMIALSPGFNLSDIYRALADGLDSHNLSLTDASEERVGDSQSVEEPRRETSAYDEQDMTTQTDDDDSTPFTSLNWDEIIQDEQREIEDSGNNVGSGNETINNETINEVDDKGNVESTDEETTGDDSVTSQTKDTEYTGNAPDDGESNDENEYSSILDANDEDEDDEGLQSEDERDGEEGEEEDDENEDENKDEDSEQPVNDDSNQNPEKTDDVVAEKHDDGNNTEPIRDDVIGYINGRMDDLRKADADQKQIIDEADKSIKELPDESGELEKIDVTISETKARLSSLEASRNEMAESMKDAEHRRKEMTERIEKARSERDRIRTDMEWLDRSKGLINR